MPDISLEEIDPRIALASIVASIALQEAAVSHVLNAEGEKIQAVVGMTGATVGDLQNINLSVGGMVDNVALLEDELQSKLRTALLALFPTATLVIYFVDSATLQPANCQCVLCALTNDATGVTSTFFAQGDSVTLPSLKPGSYTLRMSEACAGYEPNENVYDIEVDARGNVTFDGAAVTDEHPAVIELTEDLFGAAAQAVPEPGAQPEGTQTAGYQVIPFNLIPGQYEPPEAY
ncbi:MAG: prealbumin-like fold domain-containing protein [Oscillospiraceae bacterium]|nr:prealbumin-like fold domain-containing protein [Oscillospiraceae bacterium]